MSVWPHGMCPGGLKDYQYEIAETTETHSHLLQAIGDKPTDDAIHNHHLRQAIYHHIPPATLQAAVQEAHLLRRPHGYFDFP